MTDQSLNRSEPAAERFADDQNLRILILVDSYFPSTKSSAKLVYDLGCELGSRGHQVCVVAPDNMLVSESTLTLESGLAVLRVRTGRLKGASKVLRAINEARLSSVIWNRGREFFENQQIDLIVFYSPTIFFGAIVQRLKRLWKCPAYLILRDIFPQWAVDAGMLRQGGPAYWFFRRKELEQYAAADVIGVQSPANLAYFSQSNILRQQRLEVLYNWTTLNEAVVPATAYRRDWGLTDKVVFFYGGNIGVAQGMDTLLRLAERLRGEPSIHFLLVGEGSEVNRLQTHIADAGLQNISLRPAVGQQEYLGMLSEFDVGMLFLDRRLKTQNFPGKMLGYMYFGLPMLASINPGNDLQQIVETHAAGLVSEAGDDERLTAQTLELARDAHLRKRLGHNARLLLESTFAVGKAADQILQHMTP